MATGVQRRRTNQEILPTGGGGGGGGTRPKSRRALGVALSFGLVASLLFGFDTAHGAELDAAPQSALAPPVTAETAGIAPLPPPSEQASAVASPATAETADIAPLLSLSGYEPVVPPPVTAETADIVPLRSLPEQASAVTPLLAEETVIDVNEGGSGSGYTFTQGETGEFLIDTNGSYKLTGSTNENSVRVGEGVTADITLENLSIVLTTPTPAPAIAIHGSTATLTLVGDNVLSIPYPDLAALQVKEGGVLTIGGEGSIEAISTCTVANKGGFGIGNGREGTAATINITGGRIFTKGSGVHAAALTSGPFSTGDMVINISGGDIEAIGEDDGAGIGSARADYSGTTKIYISGGKIKAIGGDGAAGIGGGIRSRRGKIEISGGDIEAIGGSNAPGIGSGDTGDVYDIVISGGNIISRGGEYGVGLGSGFMAEQPNIHISGGTIVAQEGTPTLASLGGSYGTESFDIGPGWNLNWDDGPRGGNITIDGGSIRGKIDCFTEEPKNSDGVPVYLQTLTVGVTPLTGKNIPSLTVDGIAARNTPDAEHGVYGNKDIYTDDTGLLYLYLPEIAQEGDAGTIWLSANDITYAQYYERTSVAIAKTLQTPKISLESVGMDDMKVGTPLTGAKLIFRLSGDDPTDEIANFIEDLDVNDISITGLPEGLRIDDEASETYFRSSTLGALDVSTDGVTVEVPIVGTPTAQTSAAPLNATFSSDTFKGKLPAMTGGYTLSVGAASPSNGGGTGGGNNGGSRGNGGAGGGNNSSAATGSDSSAYDTSGEIGGQTKTPDESAQIKPSEHPEDADDSSGGRESAANWSLLSLLIGIAGLALSLLLIVRRRKDGGRETSRGKGGVTRIAAIVLGVLPILLFFLFDNMTNPMVFINRHTAIIAPAFLVQAVVATLSPVLRTEEEGA